MRKYSLAYLTIPGTDPVTQIRIARKTGYDFVSLRTIPMHLPGSRNLSWKMIRIFSSPLKLRSGRRASSFMISNSPVSARIST